MCACVCECDHLITWRRGRREGFVGILEENQREGRWGRTKGRKEGKKEGRQVGRKEGGRKEQIMGGMKDEVKCKRMMEGQKQYWKERKEKWEGRRKQRRKEAE